MDEFEKVWFRSLEKGICALPAKEKEVLFSECGKNCAKQGVIEAERTLYEQSGKDLDTFFQSAKQLGPVEGEVIQPDKEYYLYFDGCLCGMYHNGYIKSSELCECSRQSVLYVLRTLAPERTWQVTLVDSVIAGAKRCKLHILCTTN